MTDNILLEDREKYLLLWNKFNQRTDNLSNLIRITNGAVLTIFLAIFTFLFNNAFPGVILIVCIFVLFFWRFYVHLIDSEIISLYGRIIFCEERLDIYEDEISLKGNLNKSLKDIKWTNRGHVYFDIFAIFLIIIFFIYFIYSNSLFISLNQLAVETWIWTSIVILITICAIFWKLNKISIDRIENIVKKEKDLKK